MDPHQHNQAQHSKHESWSGTDSPGSTKVGYSGPMSGPLVTNKTRNSSKKSARFKDQNDYVEITLDVRDDAVSVQNIIGAGDQETALLASRLEQQPRASLGSQLSFRLKQVSQELRRITSSNGAGGVRAFDKVDRSKSGAARALKGLKFITRSTVGSGEDWSEIEKRFEALAVDGSLPKSQFAQCIGMGKNDMGGVWMDGK